MSHPIHSPGRLFKRRVLSHWKHQISVVRSVADWTVLLYIMIPFLFIGGGLYMELWTSPLPAWVAFIPHQMAAILLLYMFSGSVLLFVEEGDMLFLRQQPQWMKGLMRRGIGYSIIVSASKGMLFMLLALPFLYRGFQLSPWMLTSWVMLAAGMSWCTNLIVHRIKVSCFGFKKWIFSMIWRTISFACYLILLNRLPNKVLVVISFIFMFITVFLIRLRLSMKGSFTADVREDAHTRMWLTNKLLVQAVGNVPRVRSKARIFRKSGRIYRSSSPDKRFAGAGVKAFLRNSENLLIYVQFSVVGIPAVVLPPFVIKLIVFTGLMFLLSYLLHQRWIAFADDEFSIVLPFTDMQRHSAGMLAVRTLMIPPVFILSLFLAFSLGSGWGGILVAVLLTLISIISVPTLFTFPVRRRRM